ncbi:hypothetical protein LCGC14_2036730, partial [marine sediment metagenome]
MGIININVIISEETITSTYSPNRVYVGVGETISILNHNLFPDLQGGADDEYYHLELVDYTKVTTDAWVLTTGDVMTGTLQINVPTATSEALILKSTDDNVTKNLFEVQKADGTPLTVIDSAGNVGIGTDPYSGLHYQGDILYLTPAAGAGSNDNIIIKNYATGNGAPDIILRTAD